MEQNNYAVQGFVVDSFTVRGDKINVVLKGNKDDIRAGTEDIGGIVKSLEVCVTAAEDAPINCTLLYNSLEFRTYAHPFIVVDFLVKQDFIKIKLVAMNVENGTPLPDISKSLTLYTREEDKSIELTLPRVT